MRSKKRTKQRTDVWLRMKKTVIITEWESWSENELSRNEKRGRKRSIHKLQCDTSAVK